MDKILAAVNKAKAGGAQREEQYFYYPARDAAGNGSAVIRFLPGTTVDDVPFIKTFAHGFHVMHGDTKKWLIEECPTTIGNDCPICAENKKLWDTGLKDQQEIVRQRKRKVSYVSRILVVEDKKNPDNEGKVFLFKFGQKIFDKIADALQPEFEEDKDKACNVFDLAEGANFKFRIRKVEGQTNYDKSEFDTPSKCDVDVFSQFNAENDINKFLNPDKFKSAEKLQERYDLVVGNTSRLAVKAASTQSAPAPAPAPAAAKQESSRVEAAAPAASSGDSIEDIMKLVNSITGDKGDDDIPF